MCCLEHEIRGVKRQAYDDNPGIHTGKEAIRQEKGDHDLIIK
jgi:hypothetical protein